MTEIIDTVQLQELDDALVDLYEIEIGTTTVYLYNELSGGTQSVYFNAKDSPHAANEYIVFPLEVAGIEYSGDGAPARPTLTMANIMSFIAYASQEDINIAEELAELGITKNEDLLGSRITRRRTLAKYLSSSSGGGTPPIEFPSQTFILDRVSAENNTIVSFELASLFDLEGIQLPSRFVVGKYCSWKYQGEEDGFGGCTWPKNSNNLFFRENNTLITGTLNWLSTSTYAEAAEVKYNNKIWRAVRASSGKIPDKFPAFWARIDSCPKTLSACKVRFQYEDAGTPLPFGGFPGTRKFR
jgi:lambda family phage minor tail protein L